MWFLSTYLDIMDKFIYNKLYRSCQYNSVIGNSMWFLSTYLDIMGKFIYKELFDKAEIKKVHNYLNFGPVQIEKVL